MAAVMFDTHDFIKSLTASGFTEEQAETLSIAIRKSQETQLSGLATKIDLQELKTDFQKLRGEFQKLRGEFQELKAQFRLLGERLESRMQSLEGRLESRMQSLENRLEGRIASQEERTKGRFFLLQWMLGFNLALTMAVLWRLFS